MWQCRRLLKLPKDKRGIPVRALGQRSGLGNLQTDIGDRVRIRRNSRTALASLELVLALPLLLCVMALMVNFGHVSIWKIRTATNARLGIWRDRPMWNASSDPKPQNYWPVTASIGHQNGVPIIAANQAWSDPRIGQGWIRGPVFNARGGSLSVRDLGVNDMSLGVGEGVASVAIRYPFLPSAGNINLSVDHTLLDSVWQFHTMGYGSNESRRAKGWWQLEDSSEWSSEKNEFLRADQRMVTNPQRERLRPLDRDEDLIRRGYSYDFYAQMPEICSNDPEMIRDGFIIAPGGLLDRIKGRGGARSIRGVNKRMAESYLQFYRDELAIEEAKTNPDHAKIERLKEWIEQLTEFIATLP